MPNARRKLPILGIMRLAFGIFSYSVTQLFSYSIIRLLPHIPSPLLNHRLHIICKIAVEENFFL